jgi:CBS domain-containing membrane protein
VPPSETRRRWRRIIDIVAPRPAGGRLRDHLVACLGALIGISLTGLVSAAIAQPHPGVTMLIGPMGATAFLLFALPASPLSQPWPVVGGNVISALVGVVVGLYLPPGPITAAVAVAGAIACMALLNCLHPPGGATALTVVIMGAVGSPPGVDFAFVPVGLDSLLMVLAAMLVHRFSHHSYPHVPASLKPDAPPLHTSFTAADIDAALAAEHETFDIERPDLERLMARVEAAAMKRRGAGSTFLP